MVVTRRLGSTAVLGRAATVAVPRTARIEARPAPETGAAPCLSGTSTRATTRLLVVTRRLPSTAVLGDPLCALAVARPAGFRP